MQKIRFFDATGQNTTEATWDEVFLATDRIKAFFAALNNRFVERDEIIRCILFAMMMREHVLLIGKTGGGKTALVNGILDNISGANTFRLGMSDDRTKNEVYGPWSLARLRADGGYWHLTEGYLPEAHFARLGEFFDAGDGLLRSLLDALNERRVQNGPQQIRMPLMTAFADTNFAPEEMPARMAQLDAVVDRFLFRVEVPYPNERVSTQRMIEAGLENVQRQPVVPLAITDVVLVSGVIASTNIVLDRYVREAYTDVVRSVSEERVKQGRAAISPRRMVWAAQCMEVSAILGGRTTVTMEDLPAARYGIAIVPADREIYDAQNAKWRIHWIDRALRRDIEQELDAINQMTQGLPDALDLSMHVTTDLKKLLDGHVALRASVSSLPVSSVDAHDLRSRKLCKVDEQIEAVQIDLVAKLAAYLPPEVPANAEVTQLVELKAMANRVKAELDAILPKTERVRDQLGKAMTQTLLISAQLEVAMLGHVNSKTVNI